MRAESSARSGAPVAGRFLALLISVVVVLAVLRLVTVPDPTARNLEFFPDMARSPAVESQSLSAVLPGGVSQQPLVEGVVPRGALPLRYGPGEEEAKRAGLELVNPFPVDDADALARGAEVFAVHCIPCHDAAGGGQGAAVRRGMLPPPSLMGANAVGMPDGRMFHVLTHGGANMPAMRTRVGVDDRWRAVLHVRDLQRRAVK